jgi:anti-sigma factor RsiW
MSQKNKPNKTCEWVLEHVDEYVDGLLDEQDRIDLQLHCQVCRECASELDLAEAVRDGLEALPLLSCPDEVTDPVFQDISESSRAEVHSASVWLQIVRPLWRPVSVAAAVAAIVLMALFVGIDRDQGSTQPTQAEVDRALQEAKFALAVINDVGRKTGRQVGDDVQTAVIEPVRHILSEESELIGNN